MTKEPAPPSQRQETLFADFPPVTTDAWLQKITEDLDGADYERRLVWSPLEGFPVQPFYRSDDLAAIPVDAAQALRRPAGDNAWLIRQDVRSSDGAEAHRRAREALERGATTIGFCLSPTPDAPGVPVRRQDDLGRLLDGLPLDAVPIHLRCPTAGRAVLAMLLNEAERHGVPRTALRGSVSSAPFRSLVRYGRMDVERSFSEWARLLDDVDASGARLHVVTVDAQPYHEAGGSSVQALAFSLAAASELFAGLDRRGVAAARVAPRLRFRVPVGPSFFMEIAALRALRLLYPRLVQAYDPEAACSPYLEAVTSRWSLTRYDPHVNMLRATTQATAAVLGGCDELTIRPYDAADGSSSDFAFRIARNVQLLLKHEAHLDAVVDPGAGAYYLETLTDRLARHAWSLFQQVEAEGGLLEAFRRGFIQREIQAVRDRRDGEIASGKRALVGTNAFPNADETVLPDEAPSAVSSAPPEAVAAVFTADVSMEDLRARLREGAGVPDVTAPSDPADALEVAPLPAARGAEAFEALRLRTERHARETGRRPVVFLLLTGHPAMATARATFSRNVFGCAGYDIVEGPRYDSVEDGAQAALDAGADVVVLCGSDPDYAALAPPLHRRLAAASRRPLLVVAGYPKDQVETLQEAGVDDFIHLKQNLLETLERYQRLLGVGSET